MLALFAHLPVPMALVPDWLKRRRASRLAREQFFERGLHLTRARTGVLIFVAVAEHYVEIIADEGINALAAPSRTRPWPISSNGGPGGSPKVFSLLIEVVGTRLAEHFRRAADDPDELPNRLIEI